MIMMTYFSDREFGPQEPVNEEIKQIVWQGILSLIQTRVSDGSLAYGFPSHCPDGNAVEGTDIEALWNAIRVEIGDIDTEDSGSWHVFCSQGRSTDAFPPETLAILDLIEFVARHVAQPSQRDWHDFFRHYHLSLNREEGLNKFIKDINRIFSRNRLAYYLTDDGLVERRLPSEFETVVRRTVYSTGDQKLDILLDTATGRFLSPNPESSQDALEKLWDAFERLKTIENPSNKKLSAELLINKATSDSATIFRSAVEAEFRSLTEIGNNLSIRHFEQGKEPVGDGGEKDYLFFRLYSLIWFMLRATGRLNEVGSEDFEDEKQEDPFWNA